MDAHAAKRGDRRPVLGAVRTKLGALDDQLERLGHVLKHVEQTRRADACQKA